MVIGIQIERQNQKSEFWLNNNIKDLKIKKKIAGIYFLSLFKFIFKFYYFKTLEQTC